MRRSVFALLCGTLVACGGLRTMTAPATDYEDYRAFRVAAAPGTRLARAATYLDRHPRGRFADEVRAVYEEEEPRFFAESQRSRRGAMRYLVDLPHGPHADAAVAMLRAFDVDMREAELRDVAAKVRADEARLESAAVQRRQVGETILGAVGTLLDTGAPLREATRGAAPPTWGEEPSRHEQDLFFLLPTRPAPESRLLTLEVLVDEDDTGVHGGEVAGVDMFVRWAEADQIVKLDAASPEDRREAQVHVLGRLAGAVERVMPEASCPDQSRDRELLHRACGGWEVVVIPGAKEGDRDVVLVRRPRATRASAPR